MFNIKAMTLTIGLIWGLSMLCLGWIGAFGWGEHMVVVMSSLYIGFKASFFGGIIGCIWGFVDGAIGGFLFAFVYNYFFKKFKKSKKA